MSLSSIVSYNLVHKYARVVHVLLVVVVGSSGRIRRESATLSLPAGGHAFTTINDWSDWLPCAVESADPETAAIWHLGCNGSVTKGSKGMTLFVDSCVGIGGPPQTVRMIPVLFGPENVIEADMALATHGRMDHVHGQSQVPISENTDAMFVTSSDSLPATYDDGAWLGNYNFPEDQFEEVVEGGSVDIGGSIVHIELAYDLGASYPVAYVFERELGMLTHGGDTKPTKEFVDTGKHYDLDPDILVFGTVDNIPDKETSKPVRITWYSDENQAIEAASGLNLDRLTPAHWDIWKGMTADPKVLHYHAESFETPRSLDLVEIGDRADLWGRVRTVSSGRPFRTGHRRLTATALKLSGRETATGRLCGPGCFIMNVGKVTAIGREPERATSVLDGEVMVNKTSATDELPVSAIELIIRSTRNEATRIRVIDRIPKLFPVESTRFHPDFENNSWMVYKDHRVEYERTFDPGEELVTVYGIRIIDGHDQADFLEKSTFGCTPVDDDTSPDDIDDILGEDRSWTAWDVFTGSRDPPRDEPSADNTDPEGEGEVILDTPADPGSKAEAADAAKTDATAADTVDATGDKLSGDDLAAVFTGGDDGETDSEVAEAQAADNGDELVSMPSFDDDVFGDDGEVDDEPAGLTGLRVVVTDTAPVVIAHLGQPDVDVEVEVTDANVETDIDTGATGSVPIPDADGLVGTFAAEVRSDAADKDGLGVTYEAADAKVWRSTDIRVRRLQSQIEDTTVYPNTLAEFIDEEETGSDLVLKFCVGMTALREDLDALDSVVDSAVKSVNDMISQLGTVEGTITAVDGHSDRVTTRVADAESYLDGHDGRLEGPVSNPDIAKNTLDDYYGWLEPHNEQFKTVEGQLDDHDERLETTSQNIDAGLDCLDNVEGVLAKREEELMTIHERLDDIADRLDKTVDQLEGAESSAVEVTGQVSTFHDEVGDIREDIANSGGDVVETREALSDRLAEIQSRVEDAAADEKIEMLRDGIRELDDTVAELETLRERLAGTFGTGMGGDPAAGDNGDTDETE